MKNSRSEQSRAWVLVLGILAIFALGTIGIIWVARTALDQAVAPVNEVTGNIGTRIADLLNPTPTVLPDPVTIISGVRALARLETIQYTVEKIIRAEVGQEPFGVLFGDKLILVAHGTVIAGIDLGKMAPEDMQVRNGVLFVKLPAAEIFITALDNQKSYVFDRETGLLTHGDINLESAARQAAEQEIFKAAMEDGILFQARKNAELYLYRFFRDLGYPEVIFEQGTPEPTP